MQKKEKLINTLQVSDLRFERSSNNQQLQNEQKLSNGFSSFFYGYIVDTCR